MSSRNEGKCCDAVLRMLEQDLGAERTDSAQAVKGQPVDWNRPLVRRQRNDDNGD